MLGEIFPDTFETSCLGHYSICTSKSLFQSELALQLQRPQTEVVCCSLVLTLSQTEESACGCKLVTFSSLQTPHLCVLGVGVLEIGVVLPRWKLVKNKAHIVILFYLYQDS